jgi:hypothetical protein
LNSHCGFDSALFDARHAPVDAPLSLLPRQRDWLPEDRRLPGLDLLWLTSQRLQFPTGWRLYEVLATTWLKDRQLALPFDYLLHSLFLIHHAWVNLGYFGFSWIFLTDSESLVLSLNAGK